jgi:hypothetical protein
LKLVQDLGNNQWVCRFRIENLISWIHIKPLPATAFLFYCRNAFEFKLNTVAGIVSQSHKACHVKRLQRNKCLAKSFAQINLQCATDWCAEVWHGVQLYWKAIALLRTPIMMNICLLTPESREGCLRNSVNTEFRNFFHFPTFRMRYGISQNFVSVSFIFSKRHMKMFYLLFLKKCLPHLKGSFEYKKIEIYIFEFYFHF